MYDKHMIKVRRRVEDFLKENDLQEGLQFGRV